MRFKLKVLKIFTGRPVIFLHESSAKKIGVHIGDRVEINKNGDSFIAIVDLVKGFIKENEVAISEELSANLKKVDGYIEITPAELAESSSIIQKQVGCIEYSKKDLEIIM